jgi:type I restriction enzyme S subunit
MKEAIDIRERDADTVRRVLSSTLPNLARVLIFGSRANWSAKNYSDLDIAVDAGRKLKISELAAIEDAFTESDLPFRVDVVDLNSISDDFAESILKESKNFSYETSDDWQYRRLGDILDLKRGYDLPKQDRRRGDVPIISSSGEVGFHDTAMAAAPGVITGRYGTIGQVFYVNRSYWPLNTALYVRDFKGNEPKFIYYLLKTLNWAQFNDKSGVPGVNRNHVHEISVKIPQLPIQRRIARTLGSLDDKIELNRRMNETLEAMAQATFRDWFVDFGPTRRKLEGATDPLTIMGGLVQETERAQALAGLFPAALGDDGLPEGWKEATVSTVCSSAENGGTPKRSEPAYWDGGTVPWLTSGEVRSPIILDAETKITELGLRSSSAKLWPINTTVIAMYGATAGQTCILASPVSTNQACCGLLPKAGCELFLYHTMREHMSKLANLAVGAAQQNLSQRTIANFEITKPSLEAMTCFGETTKPFLERRVAAERESRTLAATRDLLLPKLMSGEIRLSEAEDLLEAAQ